MGVQTKMEAINMASSKQQQPEVVELTPTELGYWQIGILGVTPYLHNRMSEKARHELLYPKGRKNAAERASSLKHEPVEEFRASPYILEGDDEPTLLAAMASSFKGAMMTAALDMPGSSRAQIGRLCWLKGTTCRSGAAPSCTCR
jgi:hypothetical protein